MISLLWNLSHNENQWFPLRNTMTIYDFLITEPLPQWKSMIFIVNTKNNENLWFPYYGASPTMKIYDFLTTEPLPQWKSTVFIVKNTKTTDNYDCPSWWRSSIWPEWTRRKNVEKGKLHASWRVATVTVSTVSTNGFYSKCWTQQLYLLMYYLYSIITYTVLLLIQ